MRALLPCCRKKKIAPLFREADECLDDQREAAGEVIAGPDVEPHLRALLAGNDAEAVVLDLMQPLAGRGQLIGFSRVARRDEPLLAGPLYCCCRYAPAAPSKGIRWRWVNKQFGKKKSIL